MGINDGNIKENSLIAELFYKKDKKTNQLRISKTKLISLIVFLLVFFVLFFSNWDYYGSIYPEDIFIYIVIALFITIPTFLVGWLLGYFIDKDIQPEINNNQIPFNNQQNMMHQYNNQNHNIQQNMNQKNQQRRQDEKINKQLENMDVNDIIQRVAETPNKSKVKNEYNFLKDKANAIVPLIQLYLEKNYTTIEKGNKNLVELLGDINTDASLKAVSELLFIQSDNNMWYDEIVTTACRTLGRTKEKKWIPTLNKALNENQAPIMEIANAIESITGEESKHPLIIIEKTNKKLKGIDAIKYLYSIKDETDNWTSTQKAYYYEILAEKSEDVEKLKDKNIHKSFYAAQLNQLPSEENEIWSKFEGEYSSKNKENANNLLEKYTIPTIDEIKKMTLGTPEECVKKIATSHSQTSDEYEFLKEEGNNVIPIIVEYLNEYSRNATTRAGNKYLVKLLGDINTEESLDAVSELLFVKSNYTLWYDEIVVTAARTLGRTKDKKWIPKLNKALNEDQAPIMEIANAIETITGEKSKHPVVVLKDVERNKKGIDAIEYLYSIKNEMKGWNNNQKGYYYYLLAVNSEDEEKLKNTNIPKSFYSASVYYMNDVNASAWSELKVENNKRTNDNATRLHKKYPIPKDISEIKILLKEKPLRSPKGNGILPLTNKKELLVKGTPVCDVCNKQINIKESWFVPNDIFYSSEEYRKWNKDHFPLNETDSQFNKRINDMQKNDPTEGSAVCDNCIHMFEKTSRKSSISTTSTKKSSSSSAYDYAYRFKRAMDGNSFEDMTKIYLEWEDSDIDDKVSCNLLYARVIIALFVDVSLEDAKKTYALAEVLNEGGNFNDSLTPWFKEKAMAALYLKIQK